MGADVGMEVDVGEPIGVGSCVGSDVGIKYGDTVISAATIIPIKPIIATIILISNFYHLLGIAPLVY
ncbi:MAG: hypothetical protein U9P81_00735 [Euryarchaeota archaeon]|nr:hypothetical protein [Euryarchaeota archaeon]